MAVVGQTVPFLSHFAPLKKKCMQVHTKFTQGIARAHSCLTPTLADSDPEGNQGRTQAVRHVSQTYRLRHCTAVLPSCDLQVTFDKVATSAVSLLERRHPKSRLYGHVTP